MQVSVKAYAKLNLTLNLTGKSGGYHLIDSLVCSVDIYDRITLKARPDKTVTVEMCGSADIPLESNNAYRAAQAYIKRFGTCGADISINKNIPQGAGMGGSSADASGVLNAMNMLYGAGGYSDLKLLADELGSDTGYMLEGGYAVLTGRGQTVRKVQCGQKLHFLILLPESGVSTAECYVLYDRLDCGTGKSLAGDAEKVLLCGDVAALGKCLDNDLYAPAVRLNADVKAAAEELKALSPAGVCMTGSGSGVYALFCDEKSALAARNAYNGKFKCVYAQSL